MRSPELVKTYTRGTHRSRTPTETLAEYGKLAPHFGITRIANLTGLDCIGIPVFTSIRPNARSLATAQGKGLDNEAAKASALMEGIELWHAEFVDGPLRHDSHEALARAGNPLLDPRQLPHFRQPAAAAPRLWIEGHDLLTNGPCWVPFDAVTMNSVGTPERGTELLRGTNGLASGNHRLEAIVHGLCEVIERDAESLWRLTDVLDQLDLATVSDPYCREVLDRLKDAGVFAAAWDITSDVGVPTYGCAIMEPPDAGRLRSLGIHFGFGTHLAPEISLGRALTEAVQTRLTYIAGSRDDFFRSDYARNRDQDLLKQIWNEVFDAPLNVRWGERASLATGSFDDDLAILLERIRAVGVKQLAVVDLTRPEFGIPVVKVIVPGLEGPGGHLPGSRALSRMS
jgi:ribosomal protein S12 methylthiotransferase accessory factor